MKRSFDLIVVIPVGPGSQPEWVRDTMDSVQHYASGKLKFILIDDSQKGTANELQGYFEDLDILPIPKNLGKVGGLYISLAKAFRHAYEQYDFELLLRMDDDALMIGPDPHLDGLTFLSAHPNTGIIGRHIQGKLSEDCFGNVHDNYWPRKQLIKDTTTWKAIRRPLANMALRELMLKAFNGAYTLGENIQGGAYFITRKCIEKLAAGGFLPMGRLEAVNLCEDHLFSLLTRVVEMELHDFSDMGQPFGIAWKGLPASPEMLLDSGKKIIHSIRFWERMDEAEIRHYYKQQRSKHPTRYYEHEAVKICG